VTKMYHEAPRAFMQKYPRHKYLIEYPWLKDMSVDEVREYDAWILDCGIGISKKPPSMEDYIDAIRQYSPGMVVALDISDNLTVLKKTYTEFAETLARERRWTPQIMWPLRGASEDDMIRLASHVCKLYRGTLYGRPLVGIPYRKFTVANAPSSVNARQRMRFIYRLRSVFDIGIDIHLLGLWDMSEVCALNALKIASVDSSFCFLLATDATNKTNSVWHPRDPRDGIARGILRYNEGGGAKKYDENIKQLMWRVEMDCATLGMRGEG
jgi:hypothetical protein